MFKHTIEYEDFNGEKQKEEFLFNLNKSELLKFDSSFDGGLQAYMERISNERDTKLLSSLFEDLILLSYGKKSDDGKIFLKNPTITENFKCSAAYDVLYWQLMTDADFAATFFSSLIPNISPEQRSDLMNQMKEKMASASETSK